MTIRGDSLVLSQLMTSAMFLNLHQINSVISMHWYLQIHSEISGNALMEAMNACSGFARNDIADKLRETFTQDFRYPWLVMKSYRQVP